MTRNEAHATTLVRALEAIVHGDRGAVAELYTDDVKAWTPAHSVSSAAELLVEFERRDDAFSDLTLEVRPLDVGGDFGCAEWRITMTHTGDLAVRDGEIVGPTGRVVTINGVTVAEFRDGRICSLRQYWDELSVFEQLGLLHDEDPAST